MIESHVVLRLLVQFHCLVGDLNSLGEDRDAMNEFMVALMYADVGGAAVVELSHCFSG